MSNVLAKKQKIVGVSNVKKVKISARMDNNKFSLTGNVAKSSGGTGTKDYNLLINKPRINGVELIGDKNCNDIKVQEPITMAEELDIDQIIFGI